MRSALVTALLGAPSSLLVSGVLVHLFTPDNHFVLATIHGSIGWWLVPAWPLAGLALLLGRRVIALCCGLVALAHLSWVVPGHRPVAGADMEERLSVGSANLLVVNPTPARLLRELVRLDPDVWCLQEVDYGWAALLEREPIVSRWAYRHLDPDDSAFGLAFLSKEPLDNVQFVDLAGVPLGTARLGDITIACVHTEPPRSPLITTHWSRQMAALEAWASQVTGPLLLVGDLNATRHHPSWQRLVEKAGLHSSHAEVGRASAGTWPAPPYFGWGPWLKIDHILLSDELHARVALEGDASGSDHRPIVAHLSLGSSVP